MGNGLEDAMMMKSQAAPAMAEAEGMMMDADVSTESYSAENSMKKEINQNTLKELFEI